MRAWTRRLMLEMVLRVHRRVSLARTAFALPFAILGAIAATEAWPAWETALYLLLCVIFGRATVVGFGRVFGAPPSVADPEPHPDGGDPLPPVEPLPRPVWAAFAIHAALMLILFARLLNPLAGWLSIPFVGLVTVQAAIRRHSGLGHLLVGATLGVAPIASWVALRGSLEGVWPGIAALALGVTAWATAFDMIHSLQRELREGEGPGHFAQAPSLSLETILLIARLGQAAALGLLCWAAVAFDLGWPAFAAGALCALALLASDIELRRCGTESASPRWVALNMSVGPILLTGVVLGRFGML